MNEINLVLSSVCNLFLKIIEIVANSEVTTVETLKEKIQNFNNCRNCETILTQHDRSYNFILGV